MWAVVIVIGGIVTGACGYALVRALGATLFPSPTLPAATPRAIAHMRRRNRLDLRQVRPALEMGVRLALQCRVETLEPQDFEERTR